MGNTIQKSKYEKLYILKGFLEFLNCTDEKELIYREIIKITRPSKKWRFLEVGAGNGYLTLKIAKMVRESVIIEPSSRLISIIKQKLKKNSNCKIKIIQQYIENVELTKTFHLILMSHVLSSIEINDWIAVLKKIISHLNGYLLIVYPGNEGDLANLIKIFWGKVHKDLPLPNYNIIQELLIKVSGVKPKHKIINAKLTIPDIITAFNISQFLLEIPVISMPSRLKKEIAKYFNDFYCKYKSAIIMESQNHLLWIKKN